MHLIADAMQKTNSLDPAKVGAELYKGNYKGVGGNYGFDAKGNLKESPVTVFTFKGGVPTAITTY